MKKVLLSLFCSLMIGVTCFAPFTVSANNGIYKFNNDNYSLDNVDHKVVDDNFNLYIEYSNGGNWYNPTDGFISFSEQPVTYRISLPKMINSGDYVDFKLKFYFDKDINKFFSINFFNLIDSNNSSSYVSNFDYKYELYYDENISLYVLDIHVPSLYISNNVNTINLQILTHARDYTVKCNSIEFYHAKSLNELEELISPPLERFLNNVGNIFNECMNWVDSLIEIIVTTPILLLTTGFLCLGAAVGLFVRFIYKD